MSDEFWDACAPLLAEGRLVEGTIMSSTCARTPAGEFVAMPHHKGPGIVVKLHRDRVAALIDEGIGKPFAPAKKVFKEWVLVEAHDEDHWRDLLVESIDFVLPELRSAIGGFDTDSLLASLALALAVLGIAELSQSLLAHRSASGPVLEGSP